MQTAIDTAWVVVSAALVFMMQGGFLCLESGLSRSKNSINVAAKNLVDFLLAVILFWAFGYGLMFGTSAWGLVGTSGWFVDTSASGIDAFFLFQMMFCATAATIVSGAAAERIHFGGYVLLTAVISGVIYPISGHWAWGVADGPAPSGWLAEIGFVDFAGAMVVHAVGGAVGLAAILVIGPRLGRFSPEGVPGRVPASNLPLAMLGIMLIWLGWFGFNGGSTLAFDARVPVIILNTILSGAAAGLVALAVGWKVRGRPDPELLMNGSLTGLVAVTASCHAIVPEAAIAVGAVGGVVYLAAQRYLEKRRIDDAVGAVPVHLAGGLWGGLAVGIFGLPELLGTGLGRLEQFGVQVLGVGVIAVWAFAAAMVALKAIDRGIFRLRVSADEEKAGLNVSEHGERTELIDLLTTMDVQARTGDIRKRVPVEPFTEVGQIAEHYNRVIEKLESSLEDLRSSDERNRRIVETAMDAVVITDSGGRVMGWNGKAETVFGWTASEATGRGVYDLIVPPSRRSVYARALRRLLSNVDSPVLGRRIEVDVRSRDERVFPAELSVTVDRSSGVSLVTAFLRDISVRRAAEAALIEGKRAAEEASRAKSEFLATVSHELRTPINGILGMAEILMSTAFRNDHRELASEDDHRESPCEDDHRESPCEDDHRESLSDDDQRESLLAIERSGRSLLAIINDILDFSNIDVERVRIVSQEFDPASILEEVMAMHTSQAMARGITLTSGMAAGVPSRMRGDSHRLRQVLANLVGNGVKFTETGSVRFRVEAVGGSSSLARLRFEVADTGVGIADGDRERIFEAFTQVDGSMSRRYGGTGLGLAISSRLVELMGGELRVESIRGAGSTFWFVVELPVVGEWTQMEPSGRRPVSVGRATEGSVCFTQRSASILVVEDNPVNQKVAKKLLEKLGCVVQVAADGREGVERFMDGEFDLVFMDCQMPEMDGFEATAKMRAAESDQRRTPIVALTANAFEQDRQRCLEAGMDEHVAKPVTRDKLDRALRRWVPSFGKNRAAGDTPTDLSSGDHPSTGEIEDTAA